MKRIVLSVLLAMGAGFASQAAECTWTGSAGDGKWASAANWSGNAVPGASDTAIVNDEVTITFSAEANVSTLAINNNVTFTGNQALTVNTTILGSGVLTLSGFTLRSSATADVETTIEVPLEIADGTDNILQYGPVNRRGKKSTFRLKNALRGNGQVSITTQSTTALNAGSVLEGDNSDFCGTIKIYPYWASKTSHQQNDQPSIASPSASSANALLELLVEHEYGKAMSPGTAFFGTPNATYRFGALKAYFYRNTDVNAYWAAQGVTLEVGHRNEDSYARGVCVPKDGVIDWVAETATFTNDVSGLACLKLSGGGVMLIGSSDGVPAAITFVGNGGELHLANGVTDDISGLFRDSTADIVFNDRGVNLAWANALDASNSGRFVKRGSGTLTWTQASQNIAVEEGTLAVPFGTRFEQIRIAEGAKVSVDAAGKTTGIVLGITALEDLSQTNRISFANLTVPVTTVLSGENGVAFVIGTHDYVWNGAAKASWSTAANWNPAGVPAEQDCVSFADDSATTLDKAAAALKLEAAGGLWLGGSYALSVALGTAVTDGLELMPNPMSGKTGSDAYTADNRLGVTSGSLTARSVSGEGYVTATGSDLSGEAEAGETISFVGTLTARNFTKRGAGTYNLIGEGVFSGTVAVEEGTLRFGTYRDLSNVRYDFDASAADSISLDSDQRVSKWQSRIGSCVFDHSAGQRASVTNDFDGMKALFFRPDETSDYNYSRYALSPTNAAAGCATKSLFLVHRPVGFIDDEGKGKGNFYGVSGGSRLCIYSYAYSLWSWSSDAEKTDGIFTGTDYGSTKIIDGEPRLTFCSDADFGLDDEESLGTVGATAGFKGAVAEVVSFTNTLTHAEREVTTKQLLRKWNLGYADCFPLNPKASVTMKAGAVLDLGEHPKSFEVASFTGAGIVTNGILETTDRLVVQSGGALSIPAVGGTTYVLSHIGELLTLRDAGGKSITIQVPRTWFKAGRSGRMAVYCENASVKWEFPGWLGTQQPVPVYDGNGWWSIPAGGFAVRLR